MVNSAQQVGGAWVPAIPLKAPLALRLRCSHAWTPHAFEYGDPPRLGLSPVDFDCVRCGATREAAALPHPGRDEGLLARLGRRIFR
jgi:hypothetical protein